MKDDQGEAASVPSSFSCPPLLFPAWETKPSAEGLGDEIEAERLRIVSLLARAKSEGERCGAQGAKSQDTAVSVAPSPPAPRPLPHAPCPVPLAPYPPILVAPIQALMQPVPTPAALATHVMELAVGQEQSPDLSAAWLLQHGFERMEAVEVPGDFSLRGGILDVWPAGDVKPLRIEFDLDKIESIRRFDPATQRSEGRQDSAQITATLKASEYTGQNTQNLLGYLPEDMIVVFDELADISEHAKLFWGRLSDPTGLYPLEAVLKLAAGRTVIQSSRFAAGEAEENVRFEVSSIQQLETLGHKPDEIARGIAELCVEHEVTVFCDQDAEAERFKQLLTETLGAFPAHLTLLPGFLHQGFVWKGVGGRGLEAGKVTDRKSSSRLQPPTPSFVFVGHHEIFRRYQRRRRLRQVAGTKAIDSFVDLNPGDYVVHRIHGIAKFVGLETVTRDGRSEEFLTLHFDEDAVLYVPVGQIELIHKYVGFAGRPPLSKLGGSGWAKTREKAEEAILELAEDMLGLQAKRQAQPGTAFPPDTEWQKEFEGSFLYTETEDQLRVIREIKRDQLETKPMDRLLCGDVGYGKTELAMRATFKTVEAGKQVAILVPTTVLAQQHLLTFRERFADYPFRIEVLNRFVNPADQRKIIREARQGKLDILIGTHRILSRDVGFSDLGLVVIDEEQRFGVEHKERLKEFRSCVDVLTLTATPIPRTLHLSLMGLRDISTLTTPPIDRRSIQTVVTEYQEKLIKEALLRELNREGQAFFVHNRVKDIHDVAEAVQALAPEAKIVVGHGQMPPHELEEVMTKFLTKQADILVSTTIIEAGLDIPTANTIFVNNADDFGLADLHQLRGRVGRYKHKAYAYFLFDGQRPLTKVAARRLKAIEEFSELGAGFRIAMQDLEIRGAGNILGAEQSGHLNAIGYDLYCELLEQAVRKIKQEPTQVSYEVHLELGFTGNLPRAYISSNRMRMEVYRRLARVQKPDDVSQLISDLKDAFGPILPEVQVLIDLAEIKVACMEWKIKSIILQAPDLVFTCEDFGLLGPLMSRATAGSVRVPDPQHVHLRLPTQYFVPATLLALLRKMLLK